MGDIAQILDSNRNEKVTIRYNAWGELSLTDIENLFDFWGYKGGLFDRDTRLILFGTRWYFPQIGRWISEDPLPYLPKSTDSASYQDFSNLYQYARNIPNNCLDYSGLTPDEEIIDLDKGGWSFYHGGEAKVLGYGAELKLNLVFTTKSFQLGINGQIERVGFGAFFGAEESGRYGGYSLTVTPITWTWKWNKKGLVQQTSELNLFGAGVGAYGCGFGLDLNIVHDRQMHWLLPEEDFKLEADIQFIFWEWKPSVNLAALYRWIEDF